MTSPNFIQLVYTSKDAVFQGLSFGGKFVLGGHHLDTLLGQKHTKFHWKNGIFWVEMAYKWAFCHDLPLKSLFFWYAYDRANQTASIDAQSTGPFMAKNTSTEWKKENHEI